MARVQLGRTLSDTQATQIVAFLHSLTGTLPEDFGTSPELPPAAFSAPR
jgi:cytochrome c peroxidase